MRNYLEMKSLLPGIRRHFVFFDDINCSSFSLLYRNKVEIKFKTAARREEEKYQIVFCDVRRKDVDKFINAMEELKNKMLLIGNTDYEAFCEELLPELTE